MSIALILAVSIAAVPASAGTVQGRSMSFSVAPKPAEDLLEKKVTLQARRTMSLKEALDLLAAQVGSKVVVPENLESRLGAKVKGFDVKNVVLRELLALLLESHGLSFESKDYGREILLKELPKP
ncbi:MAG TPA: hypothetical protein DCM05_08180 [Elusimicrobia bacterium]|nr:hypothetical protein [Elusimicrobiota bacterium]